MLDAFLGVHRGPTSFEIRLKAYSMPFFQGADNRKITELNHGGKILLPSSSLDTLMRMNIEYPMLFKITHTGSTWPDRKSTHCGVQEFLAEEGRCYLPSWLMKQLGLSEGETVEYVRLRQATYAKFKPQSLAFLEITNPRAVLEVELRKFACLTRGDLIAVRYNESVLEFLVQELKPAGAVSIVDCDMNVEFDAPEGYVEPSVPSAKPAAPSLPAASSGMIPAGPSTGAQPFSAFSGSGVRLDGKTGRSRHTSLCEPIADKKMDDAVPPLLVNLEYKPGKLTFVRYDYKSRCAIEAELREKKQKQKDGDSEQPFQGRGATIRKRY